jgi:hypothetical protein
MSKMATETTRAYFKHRKYNALEKGTWLVQSTLQALIVLYIELFVGLDIFPYCVK